MMIEIKNKKNVLIAIIIFLVILILKSPILDSPYFWDGLFWMKSVEWMSINNLNPILPGPLYQGGLDTGHPPLVLLILAAVFFLFGKSLFIAHLIIILFTFLVLYFTYLLGSFLYNEKTGFIATALLLFSPLFFAQSGTINLDIPLAAFTVMTIYFVLRNKPIVYLVSGSFLVLSKEPGILTILAIVIYIFIKNYRKPKKILFKKCFLYASPLIPFLLWMFFHSMQQQTGFVFWRPITFIILFRFLNRVKYFFFDNFHWILTFIILISLPPLEKISKSLNIKKIFFSILTGLLFLFLFIYGFKFLLTQTDLLGKIFSLNNKAFYIVEGDLKNILLNIYSYRFIFALLISIFIFIRKDISFKSLKNKKLIPIFLTFLFYLLLLSWTINQPRYYLPLHPLFFILSAYALNSLFKRKSYIPYTASFLIIILFVTQWYSDNTDSRGYLLEKNMDYLDSVETHKLMTQYIEEHYPNKVILTFSPFMIDELRYPFLGYVKNSMNPLDCKHYDSENNYKTSFTLQTDDWYYHNCYLKKQCTIDNFIPVGKGDIREYDNRYVEHLTSNDFDLFYYSPQAPSGNQFKKLVANFNLTLIKRFEKNGKYTELYATKKFLSEKQNFL